MSDTNTEEQTRSTIEEGYVRATIMEGTITADMSGDEGSIRLGDHPYEALYLEGQMLGWNDAYAKVGIGINSTPALETLYEYIGAVLTERETNE